jgi:hypothetical protein
MRTTCSLKTSEMRSLYISSFYRWLRKADRAGLAAGDRLGLVLPTTPLMPPVLARET